MDDTTPKLIWHDIVLYSHDIQLLDNGKWLNDAIIEWYYEWLERLLFNSNQKVLFLRPALVTMIAQSAGSVDALSAVLPPDLDKRRVIWLPICDGSGLTGGGTHWSLLLYHAGTESFYYFDSMRNANWGTARTTAERIRPLLNNGSSSRQIPRVVNVDIARQKNGSDCGVYVCAITGYLSRNYFLPALKDDKALASKELVNHAIKDSRLQMLDADAIANVRADMKNTILKLAAEMC